MVIIDNFKHNAFRQVDIPKPSDLFGRVGQRVAPESDYSGDEFLSPSMDKIGAAAAVAAEVEENDKSK